MSFGLARWQQRHQIFGRASEGWDRIRGRDSGFGGIAGEIDDAPWKTAEQLVANQPDEGPLHQPIHGQTIPVFRGTISRVAPIFWVKGPEDRNVSTLLEGKEGPKVGTRTQTYMGTELGICADVAVAVARNEFQKTGKLLTVKADETLIYDARSGGPTSGRYELTIYDGLDNDFEPVMLAEDGEDNTPAYHGLIYLFFKNFNVEDYGNRIPIFTVEWSDTPEAVTTDSTLPLIANDPPYNLNTTNSLLCYDQALNRFYTWYGHDDDASAVHLGITDFSAGEETSLIPLTNKPNASINAIRGACAIPGTGLFLCSSSENGTSPYWYLLVDAETGLVIDSLATSGEDVEWIGAQPLVGGTSSRYIAAGRTLGTALDMPVAFMEVDVSAGTLTHLDPGQSGVGDGTQTHVTTGFSDSTATVFYVAQQSGKVYEARLTEAEPPVYTEVYNSGLTVRGIYYDQQGDAVILTVADGSTRKALRVDPTDGSLVWTATVPGNATQGYTVMPGGGAYNSLFDHLVNVATHRLRAGYALVVDRGSFVADEFLGLMDLADGSITGLGQIGAWADHYDQITGKIFRGYDASFQHWRTLASSLFGPGQVPIAEVLTDFSTYDGLLTDAQVSTVGLDGYYCYGLRFDRDTDLIPVIDRINELYGIDKVETGTGVKFVKKARDAEFAVDVEIAGADLVESRADEITTIITSRRKSETEIPTEIELQFLDKDADYNIGKISASRPTGAFRSTASTLRKTLSVPLALTSQLAAELLSPVLYQHVTGQVTHNLSLRRKHLAVEPSDILQVTADGFTRVLKALRVVKRPDNVQDITAEEYLTAADTTITAATTSLQTRPVLGEGHARYIHLDGPLLRYKHDLGGAGLVSYAMLTSRGQDNWPGATLWRREAGVDWESVFGIGATTPTLAVALAALPAAPWPFETDTTNTLDVRVLTGSDSDIASVTNLEMLNGANQALLGRPGRWMKLAWQNATANADGTITLDTFLQGMTGTEGFQGTSVAGDFFVPININHINAVSYDTGDLDEAFNYKAVGKGVDFDTVAIDTHTISGAAEKPYAPSNLDAVIDGSDIDISWVRRTRLSAPWKNNGSAVEAPLGESTELYKVEILDGPAGSVLRTFDDVTTEAKTYAAADITTDFGSMPAALSFKVYQWSAVVGWGYAAEATVPLA